MQNALQELADNFEEIAVPNRSRYLLEPARPEDGSAYRPG